jgi:competence protein ComEA
MRKKYVMIGIIGVLLLITGICYSCAYKNEEPTLGLITSLTGNDNKKSDYNQTSEDNQTTKDKQTTEDNRIPDNKQISDNRQTSNDNYSTEKQGTSDSASEGSTLLTSDIYVHLCGAVMQPGVYQVPEQSRVIDLIEQAGGLAKEAAGDYINQAQQVTDGQRIYIPTKEEVKELSAVTDFLVDESNNEVSSPSKKLININLADTKELMELPGVGEAKAASIIEYRTANGGFQTIEELMKIPGIKEGLFNKVSSFISVK